MAIPEVPTRIKPALLSAASGDQLDLLTEIPAAASTLESWLYTRAVAG